MSAFQAKYSAAQREAVIDARLERQLSGAKVSQLARDGALVHNGKALEPFEIPKHSVYSLAANERKRRHGTTRVELAKMPHEDAVDLLRRRLVAAAEYDLQGYERQQRKGKPDPDRLRQIIRCVREAAALPGAKDGRTHQPGLRDPATHKISEGPSRGGLAGSIIAAARSNGREEGSPAPRPHIHSTTLAENTAAGAAETTSDVGESGQDEVPGSLQRTSVASRSLLLAQPQA